MRRLLKAGGWGLAGLLAAVALVNAIVMLTTRSHIYQSPEDIPASKAALVLGTSRYTTAGTENLFFRHRIEAAAELYKQGKVQYIIVSGDNAEKSYNEPREMTRALIKLGVPRRAITLDYAGFRTLDSVVRAKEVFGQDTLTIVSQRFHQYRALFIGRHYQMTVHGYEASEVRGQNAMKVYFREILARCQALMDLYIFNKEPRYLGKRINIED